MSTDRRETDERRARWAEARRKYATAHKQKLLDYARRYRQEHRDEIKAKARAYYLKRRDHKRAEARRYRAAHIEQKKAAGKQWYLKNRERISQRRKTKHAENPLLGTGEHLRRWHGLTLEQYDTMLALQGGGCAICHAVNPGGRKHGNRPPRFHVDHDHETGATRGLLCHSCNVGIGSMKDDPAVLRAAATYLDLTKSRQTA